MAKILSRAIFFTGLCLLPLIFFPMQFNGFEGPKVVFFQRWVEVLAIFCLFIPSKLNKSITLLIFCYFFWNLITSLFGADPYTSVFGLPWRGQGLITLAHYLALVMIVQILEIKPREFALTVLVSVLAQIVYLFFNQSKYLYLGREVGTLGNPNFLAGFVAITLPMTTSLLPLIMLPIVWILWLTWSRGTIIAIALGVLIFFLRRQRVLLIITAFLIFAGTIILLRATYSPANFSDNRLDMYTRAIKAVFKRPLIGYGLENYELAVRTPDIRIDKAHNEILEILISSGVVGLGLWLSFIIVALKQKNKIIQLSLLIFLFKAQTNVLSVVEYTYFWILMGLGFIEHNRHRSFFGVI